MPTHQPSRQIRVFISSTFRDMQKERDILVKNIFPQLRKICEERNVTFTEIDLRWGITQEESDNHKTLQLCLEEIERCRPFFIGLLGERYGWIPNENEIPQELKLNEKTKWIQDYYNCSVTELEIVHGVLNNSDMDNHAFFYFRDPEYVKCIPVSECIEDYIDGGNKNESKRLLDLKNRIRKSHKNGKVKLNENYRSPEKLGDLVFKDLEKLINKLYPLTKSFDDVLIDADTQKKYLNTKINHSVRRTSVLNKIKEVIYSDINQPVFIEGSIGSGKTTLIANLINDISIEIDGVDIFFNFFDCSKYPTDIYFLLKKLYYFLNPNEKESFIEWGDTHIYDNIESFIEYFKRRLREKASNTLNLIIFDDIEKISDEGAKYVLFKILRCEIPQNFRIILTTSSSQDVNCFSQLQFNSISVPSLNKNEIAEITSKYLSVYGKKLEEDKLVVLMNNINCSNPLFLKTILAELRIFGQFESFIEKVNYLINSEDISVLYSKILNEIIGIETNQNIKQYTKEILIALLVSQKGLSFTELSHSLSESNNPIPSYYISSVLSRCESLITNDQTFYRFRYGFISDIVKEGMCKEEKVLQVSLKLIKYFESSDLTETFLQRKFANLIRLFQEPSIEESSKKYLFIREYGSFERIYTIIRRNSNFSFGEEAYIRELILNSGGNFSKVRSKMKFCFKIKFVWKLILIVAGLTKHLILLIVNIRFWRAYKTTKNCVRENTPPPIESIEVLESTKSFRELFCLFKPLLDTMNDEFVITNASKRKYDELPQLYLNTGQYEKYVNLITDVYCFTYSVNDFFLLKNFYNNWKYYNVELNLDIKLDKEIEAFSGISDDGDKQLEEIKLARNTLQYLLK